MWSSVRTGLAGRHCGGRRCGWTFVSYTSSPWEREWQEAVASGIENICPLRDQPASVAKSEAWVQAGHESYMEENVKDWVRRQRDSEVFSWYEFVNSCTGQKERIPIEPLVGAYQNPFAITACSPQRHDPEIGYDWKGFLAVQMVTRETFASMYPGGRKYLLDLGTGMYSSGSLPWLEEVYERRGIRFDEIFAWEAEPAAQSEYWQEVPDAVKPMLHLYNVPCSVDPASEANPLRMVKTLYQPGDFIVIKLDIDNWQVEQALMDQIRAEPALQAMISEMFFEQHFTNPAVPWFGEEGGNTTLADVHQNFHQFRSSGLRLHYWP